MKKRVFAILMTFVMVFSMLPTTVLAVQGEGTTIDLSEGSYTIETAGTYTVSAYTGANTLTVEADATITLEGVNITAADDTSAISIESGDVTLVIAGDSKMTGGDNGAGIYVAEGASVTIRSKSNAELTAIGNAGVDDNSGAAGIGGTYANGNSGAITIDGASVVAKGYGVHGSGIGSGSGKVVGKIQIINGANVTAYGGYYADGAGTYLTDWWGSGDPEGGAAIGGGGKTSSTIADIIITDSVVAAYGGSKAAGIGANFWSKVANNTDAINFFNQWTHSDTKIGAMLSLDDDSLRNVSLDFDPIEKIKIDKFRELLDDVDDTILLLRERKYTQAEIAEELGYKTHSAISKRIEKMQLLWIKFDREYESNN